MGSARASWDPLSPRRRRMASAPGRTTVGINQRFSTDVQLVNLTLENKRTNKWNKWSNKNENWWMWTSADTVTIERERDRGDQCHLIIKAIFHSEGENQNYCPNRRLNHLSQSHRATKVKSIPTILRATATVARSRVLKVRDVNLSDVSRCITVGSVSYYC